MGVLYYIPARRFPDKLNAPETLKGEALAKVGLGHLDGAKMAFRSVVNNGPDRGAGLCISLGIPASKTGVFKDSQTWQPCNGGDIWLGWYTDDKPGPETFLRLNALPGESSAVLGDGNTWEFVPTRALPEVLTFDSAGKTKWSPRPSDAEHFAASEWLMDYLLKGDQRPLLDVVERLSVCLGARYHVSVMEVIALGLFVTSLNLRVVCACLGIDYDELTGKKNEVTESTAPDSNSGQPEDSRT